MRPPGETQRSLRLPRSAGQMRALAFTPSGELLAATADGPNVSVWDVAQQHRRMECRLSGRTLRALALSSDAARLVACSDDGTVGCWRLRSGRLEATFSAPAAITTLSVTRDGNFVAGSWPAAAAHGLVRS